MTPRSPTGPAQTRNSIVGADRAYVIARAAENANITQLCRELADRGCNVAWGTVNKVVIDNEIEIDEARESIMRNSVGTYLEASTRIKSMNDKAREMDLLLDKAIRRAKDMNPDAIKNLKIVSDVWCKFMDGIRDEIVAGTGDGATIPIKGFVEGMDDEQKDDLQASLKAQLDADVAENPDGQGDMLPDNSEDADYGPQ